MMKAKRQQGVEGSRLRHWRWLRVVLMVLSLGFTLWFFYAVYEKRNGGETADRIGNSADTSKRLRTEMRSWVRKTFPESAARMDDRFGLFEFDREGVPVTQTDWVVLAHGLDEPGNLWADLAPVLAKAGYLVLDFRYPNDQPIRESAQLIERELNGLVSSDAKPSGFHLIGHSMGGLVLREFITHPELLPKASWSQACPVKTLIQLGTPNHGSWLATYRLPAELRDHLFKDYGKDAFVGLFLDGAGEAQIDLKPESTFLTELNSRAFPPSIYWVGVAGTGSPVDLPDGETWTSLLNGKMGESLGKIQETFPELFKGTGDGCVSVDSLHCAEMNAVYYVDANHRNMIRDPRNGSPPAIPIVLKVLERF